MFGLIKMLIVIVLLLGAVIGGLAYLPDETTRQIGVKAAGVFSKGCRGGRMLLDSFKTQLKDDAVEAAKEKAGEAVAAPAPAASK